MPDNDEQAENSADRLGCDRCEGSSGTSPLCDNDEKEIQEFAVEDLKFRPRKKKVKISEQELKELKNLEDKKGDSKLDE